MTDARSQAQNRRPKATWLGFLRDETAASAVFFALTIASTIGFVGLGAESGLWYSERRQYQSAADAGAIAGAWSVATALTANNASTFSPDATSTGTAWKEAVRNGATDSADNIAVSFDSTSKTVTVTVTQPKGSLISSSFLPSGVTIVTTASAGVISLGNPCMLALAPTGTGITISGGPTINGSGCAVSANSTDASSVVISGTATTVNPKIVTAGGVVNNGQPQTSVASTGVGTVQNPFASLALPSLPTTWPNSCTSNPLASTGGTVTAGTICKTGGQQNQPGAVTWQGSNLTWTLDASTTTSYIEGDLTLNTGATLNVKGTLYVQGNVSVGTSSTLNVNGTLIVANGNFSVQSQGAFKTPTGGSTTLILTGSPASKTGSVSAQGAINITAPKTGTYKGIAIFQNPGAPASNNGNGNNTNTFNGGSSTVINGAVYEPAQTVSWNGNSGADCTLVVANALKISGTTTMNTNQCDAEFGNDFLTEIYKVSLLD